MSRHEPWYVHAVLYVIIVVLAYVLIRVAILDPTEVIETEKYYKSESRARMLNLRQAQILYDDVNGKYTDNLDSLINFIKTDTTVQKKINGFDSLTQRSTNPFIDLVSGPFNPDSLYHAPRSLENYFMKIDTLIIPDTVIDRRGRVMRIDSTVTIGEHYFIKDPDGFGQIGDSLFNQALLNTASWE
ncbi:MAG: hypothetical protein K8F60_01965 [Melioribacteraceae bacterium]|nr:hypothetical protein [Melioribacteraceae bacterium]